MESMSMCNIKKDIKCPLYKSMNQWEPWLERECQRQKSENKDEQILNLGRKEKKLKCCRAMWKKKKGLKKKKKFEDMQDRRKVR